MGKVTHRQKKVDTKSLPNITLVSTFFVDKSVADLSLLLLMPPRVASVTNPTIRPLFNRANVGDGSLHGGLHLDDLYRHGITSWRHAITHADRRRVLGSFDRTIVKRASLHACGLELAGDVDDRTAHSRRYVVRAVSGMSEEQWYAAIRRRWGGVTAPEFATSIDHLMAMYHAFHHNHYMFLTGQMAAAEYNQLMRDMVSGPMSGYVSE